MIEVEVKVKVKNREQTEKEIQNLGFQKSSLLKETDTYFDSVFREKDTALRVRTCENLQEQTKEHFLTFKGPKLDQVSMTRKELEMKIDNAETGKEILAALGYVPVVPVVKTRQLYRKDQMTLCLDEVKHLGDFMELELLVSEEKERESALEEIVGVLGQLGYKKDEIIRTSYLSMLQKLKGFGND